MERELRNDGIHYTALATQDAVALEAVRYDAATGLVPVIVQDAKLGHVLMLAYANREALKRTYGTGQAWFWSRSRQDYWRKGATSGNVLNVVEVRIDCDGDSVLYLVNPVGPACHTGETSCFYRRMDRSVTSDSESDGTPSSSGVSEEHRNEADDLARVISASKHDELSDNVLNRLWAVVEKRNAERPQGSYTTYLFEQGVDKSAKKMGEEAVEIVIAAKNAAQGDRAGRQELAAESADLLYHLMVVWKTCGLSPSDVYQILADRAK